MVINGKAYIPFIKTAELFGVTVNALYLPPYNAMLKKTDRINLGGSVYISQRAVYDYLDEISIKDIFHKEVQACLMLILDKTTDKKRVVARKLGWKHIGTLDKFLGKLTYGKITAEIFVRMCRHYMPIVKLYDKEYL